jgi:hypothetical protein
MKTSKFRLIGAMAAMLIATTAFAQRDNLGFYHNFGIKGGLNVYTIHSDNNSGYDSKTGFHLGLISHIHIKRQFALQPEITFSTQGAQSTSGSTTTKLNLNYVNLPLMFQYMFDNGFRLQAGPQIGFLTGAKSAVNNTDTGITNNYKVFDLGIGVGASYVHPPSGFGVDARYNLGLNNINDNGPENLYNRGFQVGVFYLFMHKS